jgi:hypothetical protein
MPNELDRKMMDDYSTRWAGDNKAWMKTLFKLMNTLENEDNYDSNEIEGRFIHLIAEVYVQGWQDGFTARLSGVKGD